MPALNYSWLKRNSQPLFFLISAPSSQFKVVWHQFKNRGSMHLFSEVGLLCIKLKLLIVELKFSSLFNLASPKSQVKCKSNV